MEKTVTIISLIASLITIGDMVYKIAFMDNYDYSTSISLILVVIVLQLAFYYLLDLKISENESYVSLVYYAIIPIIISVSGWGFYKTARLDLEHYTSLGKVLLESFKAGSLIVIAVGLFLFWSKATKSTLYKKSHYLSFAFGIPSVIVFSLAASRYTFQNNSLDVYFVGFIILLIITILLAGIVKTIASEAKGRDGAGFNEIGVTIELSAMKVVLISVAVLSILLAGITGHWFIAFLISVFALFSIQPKIFEKTVDIIDKNT